MAGRSKPSAERASRSPAKMPSSLSIVRTRDVLRSGYGRGTHTVSSSANSLENSCRLRSSRPKSNSRLSARWNSAVTAIGRYGSSCGLRSASWASPDRMSRSSRTVLSMPGCWTLTTTPLSTIECRCVHPVLWMPTRWEPARNSRRAPRAVGLAPPRPAVSRRRADQPARLP